MADPTVVSAGESTGNWGGGNEYEMQSYLASLGLPTDYVTEDYDMQQLFDGEILWSSAMTYNEMGLVLEAGYTMDDISVLYMEDEGFGMLEDCLIVDTEWAEANEDTVVAFLQASNLGWRGAWRTPPPRAAWCSTPRTPPTPSPSTISSLRPTRSPSWWPAASSLWGTAPPTP